MSRSARSIILRVLAIAAGLTAIAAAWWIFVTPQRTLEVRHERAGASGTVPVTIVRDRSAPEDAPAVLVAHGFAASRRIMMGYARELAYAGYTAAVLDFQGHGANPTPLDRGNDGLQRDLDAVLELLGRADGVATDERAIVGHSMGSGAAMQAGIRLPDTFQAVVAISPTDAAVTETLPRNLLLQAGTWEQRFLANARELLDEAGGETVSEEAFAAGTARDLFAVGNREHITILFSGESRESAVRWLDRAFEREPVPAGYDDRRPLAALLHVAGWLLLAAGVRPLLRRLVPTGTGRGLHGLPAVRTRWWWLTLVIAPFLATGALALLTPAADLGRLGGLLVGGTIALWFGIAGAIWLAAGIRLSMPPLRSLLLGAGLFGFLWVSVGPAAHQTAVEWLLIPYRLMRWPLASLLAFPWLLAAGYGQAGEGLRARVGMYLLQTVTVVGGLALAGILVPGLFFVVLALPALPVILAVMAAAGWILDDPWAYAVGNSLFLGWVLAALFPLAA